MFHPTLSIPPHVASYNGSDTEILWCERLFALGSPHWQKSAEARPEPTQRIATPNHPVYRLTSACWDDNGLSLIAGWAFRWESLELQYR